MRGFAAIGLHRPKTDENVGSVMRAAYCYNASMVAISGNRLKRDVTHSTNTPQAHKHIPVLRGDLYNLIPHGAVPVAVDLVDDAIPLMNFTHPISAFYIFGPEDGTLGSYVLSWCKYKIMVPTRTCMNLAACVNVVLYDRMAKQHLIQQRVAQHEARFSAVG